MKRLQRVSGFTLVEVMVAVVIGAIISLAAYQVLVDQGRVYETQDQSVAMQRSARAALDFLCEELREAGYGADNDTGVFVTLLNNDSDNADIDNGTDLITFVANPIQGSIIAADAGSTVSSISVHQAPNQAMDFKAGDVLTILDWNKAGVIDSVNVSEVTITPGEPTVLTLSAELGGDVKAGYIATILPNAITYRVSNRILERDQAGTGFQPLADDVEDLQITYAFDQDGDPGIDLDAEGEVIWAVDSNGDGVLDTQVKNDGTTAGLELTVDTIGNQRDCNVRAVKVSILVRTARENPDLRFRSQYIRPRVEDHAAGVENDGYRRCLLQRVVKLRNLGMG